jgi:hypothetical protein
MHGQEAAHASRIQDDPGFLICLSGSGGHDGLTCFEMTLARQSWPAA